MGKYYWFSITLYNKMKLFFLTKLFHTFPRLVFHADHEYNRKNFVGRQYLILQACRVNPPKYKNITKI